ncbi:unnamed protein product, partial [Prorocentrum cordatum]
AGPQSRGSLLSPGLVKDFQVGPPEHGRDARGHGSVESEGSRKPWEAPTAACLSESSTAVEYCDCLLS